MTSGRGDEANLAAGGPARHVPVLRDEVMTALALRKGGLYLDATFGAGGYSKALLAKPYTKVLALDRDPAARAALSRKGAIWKARPGGAAAWVF
jgi:16S rRNA (cytosine1402-N4)-methyltransferase